LNSSAALEQWRADAERRDQESARERETRKREQQHAFEARAANEAAQLRRAFEQRLAAAEQAICETATDLLDFARATREAVDALSDQRVDLSREQRDEIRDLKVEVAKLGSALAEMREEKAKGAFQFARDKTGIDDSPDPPLPRRDLN
jgi:hypothetical protein